MSQDLDRTTKKHPLLGAVLLFTDGGGEKTPFQHTVHSKHTMFINLIKMLK